MEHKKLFNINIDSNIPKDCVYIGRPSKWGNPFYIGTHGSRKQVIEKYENYLKNNKKLLNDLNELIDRPLKCFCAPLPCHGDVLLKYINDIEMQRYLKF